MQCSAETRQICPAAAALLYEVRCRTAGSTTGPGPEVGRHREVSASSEPRRHREINGHPPVFSFRAGHNGTPARFNRTKSTLLRHLTISSEVALVSSSYFA